MNFTTCQIKDTGKYRLFPDLTPEEDAALGMSIQQLGVREPLLLDQDLEIMDGRHRLRWCHKLKITKIPCRVEGGNLTDEDKRHLIIAVNLHRRHLNRKQRREILRNELFRAPDLTSGYLAELCGVDKNTATKVRSEMLAAGEIPDCEKHRDRRGRLHNTSVLCSNNTDLKHASERLNLLGDDAPKGLTSFKRLTERAGEKRRVLKEQADLPIEPDHRILHCEFRKMADEAGLKPESVPLIFTDPPYHRKFLPLWDELGKFAARYLREGGFLVAYSGTRHLNECMKALNRELNWYWLVTLIFPHDEKGSDLHRKIIYCYRPLLVFAKGKPVRDLYLKDVFYGTGKEKGWHHWQQDIAPAQYYIRELTTPGDLVVDPFVGGGTFAVAAKLLRRRFLGCDVDECAVNRSRTRLLQEIPPQKDGTGAA